MASKSPPSFVARLRAEASSMHPAERRLADFVLNFQGELASYTATELARQANVSNATVSRFVQKLGYASYEEARRHVRAERQSGAALFLTSSDIQTSEKALGLHVEHTIANLNRTFAGVTLAEIDAVATTMLKARHVWVVGFRTSHSFATYLQWQTLQVIEAITALPGAGQTLAENIASMTPKDCVVIFGLSRRLAQMDAILAQVIKSGARVLYITDEGVARQSGPTWHFRCETSAPGPLFDHVAVLSVAHLLATRTIELARAKGRKRLTAIETIHDALDEL